MTEQALTSTQPTDPILDRFGIRCALDRWGMTLSESQVERAVNGRKIPVVLCPVTKRLVIRESVLKAWKPFL